jgi:hypothetical protein
MKPSQRKLGLLTNNDLALAIDPVHHFRVLAASGKSVSGKGLVQLSALWSLSLLRPDGFIC